MFSIFKRKKEANHKLSFGELIWFGFNYTVGITFTAVFASLVYSMTKSNGANLGAHMIWIFLVEGLIAGTCAWAFARLSRVHPGSNGAAYIYTRSSYGKFWGWFISFVQYSSLPLVVTSQIVSIIRINFTGDSILNLTDHIGPWTNITLDMIGITIYGFASCVLFFGIKVYKRFVNASAGLQWGSTFLLMIAVIYLFAKAGTSNFDNVIHNQSLTVSGFSQAFLSCFFFFLGFETYATIGKNVRNPQKNIGRSIIVVMIISTIFYMTVTALMIGAVSGGFDSSPNLQVFASLNVKWLGTAGLIIMLICTISLKSNAGMQNTLYSGGMIEPMSVENYIPAKFKTLNKERIPYKAAFLNVVITFSIAAIWLIIPDLVQAITDYHAGIWKPSNVIDYSVITGEASLFMVIVYMTVVTIALKLSFQKKLRHNWLEIVIWIIAFIFLGWQFIMWFIQLAQGFQSGMSELSNQHAQGVTDIVSNSIQIIYVVLVFTFAIAWYKFYYMKKLNARIKAGTQKVLDDHFRLEDDWAFVAKDLQLQIEQYMQRNQKILKDRNNKNHQIAVHLRNELLNSEGSWKETTDIPIKE